MKRIHIIGIAFAAIFAFSMISASGASAFSLWDQCTKTANPLEFTEENCMTATSHGPTWGWEELKAKETVKSLPTTLTLSSDGTTIECKGVMEGNVGAGSLGEVTKLLNEAETEEITETKRLMCTLIVAGLCTAPVTAGPQGLPWKTELTVTNNNLLEDGAWLVVCNNKVENLCARVASLLTVENLLSALEVDLGFKKLEEATCTIGKGTVEGTVSILLTNGNALRAM